MSTDPRFRALCRHLAALNAAHHSGELPLWELFRRYAAAFQAYRKGDTMPEIRTVQLSPPQACGMLKGDQICGKPAVRATVEAAAVSVAGPAGYLLVLPICPECASATLAGVATPPKSHDLVVATVTLALPDTSAPAVLEGAAQILDDHIAAMRSQAKILRERAAEIARSN